MDFLTTIFIALLSTLVGGLITWFVSRFYYVQASKDLSKEANDLRQLTELMLRGMEEAGWVEYKRDDEGNTLGMVFRKSIRETAHATDKVEATLIPGFSEKKDT